MLDEVAALETLADGQTDAGIAALRAVAARETALPLEFGPPAVPKPSLELLGDVLLKAGRAREAADAYTAALARAPGRTLALDGLASAEQSLGDTAAAGAARLTLGRYVRR